MFHFDARAVADALGYPAAGLGILIESSGIPFPGEALLLAAAAWAAAGHHNVLLVWLLGAAGSIVGGDIGYFAGYRGGRPFVERFGRLLRINPGHLARTELFFTRYGSWSVVIARFVIGLRTWFSVLAGMSRMPFLRFQLFSAIGGVLWSAVITTVGFLLGHNWNLVLEIIKFMGLGGLAVVGLAIGAVVIARMRGERTRSPQDR